MSLLIDEYPLMVLPQLAKAIGLNEAMVLQQVHYWLGKSTHYHENRRWVYNTYDGWQEQFPFWSVSTIQRTIKRLAEPYKPKGKKDPLVKRSPLILINRFNKHGFDKTNWYTVDRAEVRRIESEIEARLVNLTSQSSRADHTNTRDYAETTNNIPEPEVVPIEETFPPGRESKLKQASHGLDIKPKLKRTGRKPSKKKKPPFPPTTPAAKFMFERLGAEAEVKQWHPPTSFKTLAQREKFEHAEEKLGDRTIRLVTQAMEQGHDTTTRVTNYLGKCTQEKPRARAGEVLDCDEWCEGMPPRLKAGETLIINAPPIPTSINPGG